MRHRIRGAFRALVISIVGTVAVVAETASAATLIVTSDSGGTGGPDCTLRDAITAANTDTATGGCPAGSGADIIELPVGATITLTEVDNEAHGPNGLPSVTSVFTINGNGTTIQRDDADRTPEFRIFQVPEGGDLTLNDLTVSDGSVLMVNSPERLGGGIYNVGTLTLASCTVLVSRAAIGGGIFNDTTGTLTLTHSTISGNVAGGLFSSGGGIYNTGTLTLTHSTISGNGSAGLGGSGGGIANAGTLTLAASTVSGNGANGGSGIINWGMLTLTNSTINGNGVGGIASFGTPTLNDLTVSGRSALIGGPVQLGGGILNAGTLTLTNSTVSGNWAYNGGGGIFNRDEGTLTLINSIVANSTYGADCENDDGTVTDDGYNIIEDGTCITAETSMMGDPMLGPLQDNGGPTETHALLEGSPAIDAIPIEECAVATDQRGVPRPQGDGCDIGAYEIATPCPWDLNGDGTVGVADLLQVISSFGPCEDCPEDFDDDGLVGALDLLVLIQNFGPCPVAGCPWDMNGDGVVDLADLQEVIDHLGPCEDPDDCPWDVNGDGIVNQFDALEVGAHFGPCP